MPSPSLVLGTQLHSVGCAFSLVRHCGQPGRPGVGLYPPNRDTAALFWGLSHFIKKASQVSASASTICYSAILPFVCISEHQDIFACAVFPQPKLPFLCFSACEPPPCSSTPRSVVICAVLSLHSTWVNFTLLGSWGLFLFLFPLSASPTGVGPRG